MFGNEPFSSALRMSNIKNWKYEWVWDKKNKTGILNCKKRPLKQFENISVFYKKQCTYNPQMTKGKFRNKKIKLAEELGIFDTNQLKQMENNLDKTKNNKTEAEEKIQKLDNEISDLKKSIPNILIDIETKLRSTSATKYHIKV